MVSITPPVEKGVFAHGNGRSTSRTDGQDAQAADSAKTRPAFTAEGITLSLSGAASVRYRESDGVRGASGIESARKTLSGAAADLDRKVEQQGSPGDALRAKRTALTLALASGEPKDVAEAARRLAEAKAEAAADEDRPGYSYRASLVVEVPTVAYNPDSGRYVPSTRRIALSVEKEPGEASIDPTRVEAGDEGVAVIHRDPAVPMRTQITGLPASSLTPAAPVAKGEP